MAMPTFLARLMARSPAVASFGRGGGWIRYALLIALASLVVFAGVTRVWPWQPGRIGGLIFGTLAALLFVNAALYPWRRRWRTRPLGTAQRWLQLHISGSLLAFWFVLIHAGFRWPAGTMGW